MSGTAPARAARRAEGARAFAAFTIALTLTLAATRASAQLADGPAQSGYKVEPGTATSAVPKALWEVGFDQNLDKPLPLEAGFTDDQGRLVRLGEYFGARPVVLVMVYYNCPMLCPMILNGLATSLSSLSLEAGHDFDVVVVSIDPREDTTLAAEKKAVFVRRYRRSAASPAIHFLTGEQASITSVAKAVGFRYVWDDTLKQFAHPAGITVVTPQGRLSRYLFGIDYNSRDLRLALVEASAGRIGTPVDALLLYCFHYDPQTGKYGFAVMAAIQIAGAVTVFAMGAFIFVAIRRERRSGRDTPGA